MSTSRENGAWPRKRGHGARSRHRQGQRACIHPAIIFCPWRPCSFWGLGLLFAIAVALVELGILSHAYEKMGVHRRYVFAVLFWSLLGSYVNLPVARLPGEKVLEQQYIQYFLVRYPVPVIRELPGTVIAVNIGGAIIPTILSLYLLMKNTLYVRAALGVAAVSLVVYNLATLVPGLGVAVPRSSAPDRRRRRLGPFASVGRPAGVHFRHARHADRRRLDESGPFVRPARADGLDRRRGNLRRRLSTGIIAVLLA